MNNFRRVLLKLSGESLMGAKQYGIDNDRLADYAQDIEAAVKWPSSSEVATSSAD